MEYAFAIKLNKPRYWRREDYLDARKHALKTVDTIIRNTNMKEKYSVREWNKNVDVVTGSTSDGRYALARWGPEIRVVSEDKALVDGIMFAFRHMQQVTSAVRLNRDNVKLGVEASDLLRGLLGPGALDLANAEQLRLALYE